MSVIEVRDLGDDSTYLMLNCVLDRIGRMCYNRAGSGQWEYHVDTPAVVTELLSLQPWCDVEIQATKRTRSVRVAQTAEAIHEALSCYEYTRAAHLQAQRRQDATLVINLTWFE